MPIIIIIVILIAIWIISKIYKAVGGTVGKAKVAMQVGSNPDAALQTVIRNLELATFTVDEYTQKLIEIAETTGHAGAMVKLSELYTGEKYSVKKNIAKSKIWRQKAAEAGDLNSITEMFGFMAYDVADDAYDEMLRLLNNVKPADDNEAATRDYALGIVYYKRGDAAGARKLFEIRAKTNGGHKFMLAACFEKEGNFAEAERILLDMADNAWKGFAPAHKKLWSYYIDGNKGVKPDYLKALEYAQKYGESEGADKDTAEEMLGKAYCNLGTAHLNGTRGLEKDVRKAYDYYAKAAELGEPDAFLPFGLLLWTGEADGVFVNRNYFNANVYLSAAVEEGNPQAKEYLDKYGVDGIIVAPLHQKEAVYKLLNGYELTATAKTLTSIQLYFGTRHKSALTAHAFADSYASQFNSFKELMGGVFTLYGESVALMLQWGINLLMSAGIDSYDAAEIMGRCEDLGLLHRIPKFERGLETIDRRAAELNMNLTYTQAARRSWIGGGIGTTIGGTIGASIRGSVAAGAMNVGSGVLHGIGDSIVKGMNNSEINGMLKKLYKKPDTALEFRNAVESVCNDIGDAIIRIMEENGDVGLEQLAGEIAYNGENLGDIDDKALDAKIKNNLAAGNLEYGYALLLEKLRRRPRSSSVLNQLYDLTGKLSKAADGSDIEVLKRYSGDFGYAVSD